MRRIYARVYAIILYILMLASVVCTVIFMAWNRNDNRILALVLAGVGFILSYILTPIVHELGHVYFAKKAKMALRMSKFSFLRVYYKDGKYKVSFANPFEPDQTQVIPKMGGDMVSRVKKYTLGGIINGCIFSIILTFLSIVLMFVSPLATIPFAIAIPYSVYSILLNIVPFEYDSGKTDGAVWLGIKNGKDAEKTMLNAMEIYGQLYSGKSYSEIDESLYYDVPQLPEDEPLYAVMLDLRYRYNLEKGELNKAAKCINALASSAEYLNDEQTDEIAAELVYMNCINGDFERANESAKICQNYLKSNTISAKRILATFAFKAGEREKSEIIIKQGEEALKKEQIAGIRKFESILLSRITW